MRKRLNYRALDKPLVIDYSTYVTLDVSKTLSTYD